ncbi:hypothetical protein ACTDI4_22025 [Mesorhizobium sp. PUT5]|uniref:hypothetical protein n=1 Tax=Mesorhizobium sp. PUT5 TaxID=3454629 RepID=UPI003FA49740
MTVFLEKVRRLPETIDLVSMRGCSDIAAALSKGKGRLAIAIGSGGSAVVAEFFARCRATLQLGLTIVMTPMQFVLSMEDWSGCDIWLFSAGANNPDIAATFRVARASNSSSIQFLTVNGAGETTIAAMQNQKTEVFLLPVADPKDGFLATHSMVAMVTALLLASDLKAEQPQRSALIEEFQARASKVLTETQNANFDFRSGDALFVLYDPQITSVAALIETSLWETGIAPVQRTDFRNFAHGRHVWAAKHPDKMFVLALTTSETGEVWQPIGAALPEDVRTQSMELDHGGRLANAVGILWGLSFVQFLGERTGIDPGRPGRGAFAETIYDNAALETLSRDLTSSVRHKASARLHFDPINERSTSLCAAGRERLSGLAGASFAGLALDYDGTVVPNTPREARLGPPSPEIMDELVRLLDGGVQVGFATGRGGSAGDKLREAFPPRLHANVVMGYYNGAHIRTLDVNVKKDRPQADLKIAAVARWLTESGLLREGVQVEARPVQIAVDHTDVVNIEDFVERLAACPHLADGSVKCLRSNHSFDIVPASTSKVRVVEELARRAGDPEKFVLGIGDSGSPLGNDRELLSGRHCVSVGTVCGASDGAWTLFGSAVCGPDALLRILKAVQIKANEMMIDLSALNLEQRP